MYNTVVITGGSSGIGLDLAKAYAKQGCNVVLLARNQEKLDIAVEDCNTCTNSAKQRILAFSVDVSNSEALEACVEQVKAAVEVPDLLILSAGIVQCATFIEQSDQSFQQLFDINVMGSRAVALAFLPQMIAKGKGQICFVSSLAGLISTYGYSGYSASKFAVIGMAGAARQELREQGIGVSVLCPPEVDTPMIAEESKHILPQTRFIKNIGGTLDVETVTSATLRGLVGNRFIIVPGVRAKLSYAQARFAPRIFGWVMQKLVNLSSRSSE